jgi:D-alanyl-D-alanine carboxypeptidase
MKDTLIDKYSELWVSMGITSELIRQRGLPLFEQANELVELSEAQGGRHFLLTLPAVNAWNQMKAAAARDDVEIYIVSAFRSVQRQCELIMKKTDSGQSLDRVLKFLAPPGCSEHHTGNAIDLGSGEALPLDQVFESTTAFSWLQRNASRFGFRLSYPRNNRFGYVYEPWHWCYSNSVG